MTNADLLMKFKDEFPSAKVSDFRPICHELFTDGKQGITIWLEDGSVVEYYPNTKDNNERMTREELSEETSTTQEKHQLSEETPTDRPTKSTNIPTEPTTKALKSQPSEDLIKRSDAIEAIELVDWYHQNKNKDMVHGANDDEHQAWYKAEDVYKALEAVPSADRPKGKWAQEEHKNYKCSICGVEQWDNTDFCPNCGADMRGEDE